MRHPHSARRRRGAARLRPGRVAQMVRDAVATEGHIVCHETGNPGQPPGAVYAGFAAHPDAGHSLALRVAAGFAEYQDPVRRGSTR